MKVKNLKKLRKEIEKGIRNALKKEVFETVKYTELVNIDKEVYEVYPTPKRYERRYEKKGLGDEGNIVYDVKKIKEGTLSVENVTEFNERYKTMNSGEGLVDLIEKGQKRSKYQYDYPRYPYAKARPFITRTREELMKSKRHVEALKEGLKRNGFKVK